MPRMPELNFSIPKIGNRESVPDRERTDAPAKATSPEERHEQMRAYAESNRFAADNARAAELLLKGDEAGLVEFGKEDAAERAAARVAEIRAAR